jgi:hypothetical protein
MGDGIVSLSIRASSCPSATSMAQRPKWGELHLGWRCWQRRANWQTELGITGWPEGEATKQVRACFESWLANRGGKRAVHDEEGAVRQVKLYLERYEDSRFEIVRKTTSLSESMVRDRAGFRRQTAGGNTEFLFLQEVFKTEVCNGFNYRLVLKALEARGYLRRQGRELTIKTTVAGKDVRVYCVSADIFKDEGN